jgi:hypothetical protein
MEVTKTMNGKIVLAMLVMGVFALGSVYAEGGPGGPGPDSADAKMARDVVFADSDELAGSDYNEHLRATDLPAPTNDFGDNIPYT